VGFCASPLQHSCCLFNVQEEKRQNKALRARHLSELQEIQIAHNMQVRAVKAFAGCCCISDPSCVLDGVFAAVRGVQSVVGQVHAGVRPDGPGYLVLPCHLPCVRCPSCRALFCGAQMYIQQMTERHAQKLREFQEELHAELTKKPPKYSKELLDWRRREQLLAKCVPNPPCSLWHVQA
jgi:hypothetical protein